MKVEVDENGLIKQMMRVSYQTAQYAAEGTLLRFGAVCQSPIELMMLHGLMQLAPSYGDYFQFVNVKDHGSHAWSSAVSMPPDEDHRQLLIIPQAEIETYTADFCLFFYCSPNRVAGIVVECDGHEFHNARGLARLALLAGRAPVTGSALMSRATMNVLSGNALTHIWRFLV